MNSVLVVIINGCLANSPTECRDFKLTMDEQINEVQCVMAAPVQIQKWQIENPAWQFKKITCKVLPIAPDGTLINTQNL